MGKPAIWYGNGRRRRMKVFVDFCFLAGETFPSPPCDIGGQGMPDKSRGYEASGCSNARMAERMDMIKDLFSKGKRNEGTENRGGGVTEE
jgi:hypothetical protein